MPTDESLQHQLDLLKIAYDGYREFAQLHGRRQQKALERQSEDLAAYKSLADKALQDLAAAKTTIEKIAAMVMPPGDPWTYEELVDVVRLLDVADSHAAKTIDAIGDILFPVGMRYTDEDLVAAVTLLRDEARARLVSVLREASVIAELAVICNFEACFSRTELLNKLRELSARPQAV